MCDGGEDLWGGGGAGIDHSEPREAVDLEGPKAVANKEGGELGGKVQCRHSDGFRGKRPGRFSGIPRRVEKTAAIVAFGWRGETRGEGRQTQI